MAQGKKDCQSLLETPVDSHLNLWTYSICYNMFAYLLKYISYLNGLSISNSVANHHSCNELGLLILISDRRNISTFQITLKISS